MTGISVLSNTPKGGHKLEKTATPKGQDLSDSPANAAAGFAAMLSGSMNSNVASKGQNSKDDQGSEEIDSDVAPMPSEPNPNLQGSMLGYSNFALSNLFQSILQSDLPAGKEANSGNEVNQGVEGLATGSLSLTIAPIVSGNKFELAMLNSSSLVSQGGSASTGMTAQEPQGVNPGTPELDKYRQVIGDLLVALSGEIKDPSLKGSRLNLEGFGTTELRQEMVKLVQGWRTATDDVVEEGQAASGQKKMQPLLDVLMARTSNINSNPELKAKAATLLAALNPFLEQEGETLKDGQAASGQKKMQPLLDVLMAKTSNINSNPELNAKAAKLMAALNPFLEQEVETLEEGKAANGLKKLQQLLDVLMEKISNINSNPELNAKAAKLMAALNPFLKQEVETQKMPQGINDVKKSLKGNDLGQVAIPAKVSAFLTNVQQKSEGIVPQEEFQKGDSKQLAELSGNKEIKSQSSNVNVGVISNLVVANVAEGRTNAIPVWEQISNVLREQVLNKQLTVKELEIKLHPADLGKIQIGMRWENGQLHLVVQASEASTGQLLQNQLSNLRQNLTDQGVNCGMLQMGQGGERQQNPQGDASQRTFTQSSEPNEDENVFPVTNPLSLGQGESNRVNVMA